MYKCWASVAIVMRNGSPKNTFKNPSTWFILLLWSLIDRSCCSGIIYRKHGCISQISHNLIISEYRSSCRWGCGSTRYATGYSYNSYKTWKCCLIFLYHRHAYYYTCKCLPIQFRKVLVPRVQSPHTCGTLWLLSTRESSANFNSTVSRISKLTFTTGRSVKIVTDISRCIQLSPHSELVQLGYATRTGTNCKQIVSWIKGNGRTSVISWKMVVIYICPVIVIKPSFIRMKTSKM